MTTITDPSLKTNFSRKGGTIVASRMREIPSPRERCETGSWRRLCVSADNTGLKKSDKPGLLSRPCFALRLGVFYLNCAQNAPCHTQTHPIDTDSEDRCQMHQMPNAQNAAKYSIVGVTRHKMRFCWTNIAGKVYIANKHRRV